MRFQGRQSQPARYLHPTERFHNVIRSSFPINREYDEATSTNEIYNEFYLQTECTGRYLLSSCRNFRHYKSFTIWFHFPKNLSDFSTGAHEYKMMREVASNTLGNGAHFSHLFHSYAKMHLSFPTKMHMAVRCCIP